MISRRAFLRSSAGLGLGLAGSSRMRGASAQAADQTGSTGTGTPQPNTPIEHFVVLMQENHSFDNYFGTYPGADGIPPDVCMPVDPTDPSNTACVKPFRLGGRALDDPDHSNRTHERQYRGGRMDGFIWAHRVLGDETDLAMGYYDDRDMPFYWNVADQYVLFDRFFSSAKGGSVVNHMYWMTGVPGVVDLELDRIPDEGWGSIPTIFDRLEERGVSWKVYVQHYDPTITFRNRGRQGLSPQLVWVPLLSYPRFIDNPALFAKIAHIDSYFADLREGTLPQVAFVVPVGASEHPPGSIVNGARFVKRLINGLMRSNYWNRSAFMWSYDDWGGWYDHVPPPAVDDFGYGFRVPALLVSPYAKRGYIDHTTLDFTSFLKFIEENFDLEPLATRDAQANNFLDAFDFSQPPRPAEIISAARGDQGLIIPRRSAIYASYTAALALPGLVVGAALLNPNSMHRIRGALAGLRRGWAET